MIVMNIKIFLQNIHKNNFVINIILETQCDFNIIFIQELSWSVICSIPSSRNKEGYVLIEIPNHSNWTTFSRNPSQGNDSPRVVTYINI